MKKKIFIITIIVLLIGLGTASVFFFSGKNNPYAYTVEEQQWLDNNKNEVVDIYMPTGISALTLDGKGVFFDFIDYFTSNTGITMHASEYDTEVDGSYVVEAVKDVDANDIEILKDNYVVITKNNVTYNDMADLSTLKIGFVKSDEEQIRANIDPSTVNLIPYDTKESMVAALNSGIINGMIGLKSVYLNDLLANELHIAYQIFDMERTYVLHLDDNNNVLNGIIEKELKKFIRDELSKSYNSNLFNTYIETLNISEKELSDLNSKVYTYGYIDNGVYDNTSHKTLRGINYFIIKDFAAFANIDMDYAPAYANLNELQSALNENKIDFYFDNTSFNLDDTDNKTVMPRKDSIVFLTSNKKNASVYSLNYLIGKKVSVLKNSKIEKLLTEHNIEVESYDSYKKLFGKLNKDTILAMELSNYEYYKPRKLNDFHIAYIYEELQNYGFVVSNNNSIFKKLFNFYLEYTNLDLVINIDYVSSYEYEGLNIFLLIAVILLLLILICQFFGRLRKLVVELFKHKKSQLSKDEKLRYIDSLTSLKNRTYLNDNIEKWDNSEIYPQVIIIVDLNSVSYINDNFGREEGDKVITEAANILIQNQLPNTEIIRTDGNEFLVYMVKYEEKKAISYIRKLNREFKNLSHGFGAAIGYSIINDAIKTLDDAVNEATLDMKTNKELMMKEEK